MQLEGRRCNLLAAYTHQLVLYLEKDERESLADPTSLYFTIAIPW